MKKIFLFLFLMAFSATSFSQGISFEENHNLNDALAKAKAENKLIFIDAYASWCGPCKMMSARIFPQKEVGDYFNAHFINLKLDMEAADNLQIAKKYEVKAYPTYLFLDSDGEIVHRALGGMPADDFIKVAQIAGDTDNNFAGISKKIKKGDRSAETLKKYFGLNPYDPGNEQLVSEYFSTLTDDQKTSKDAWEMFNEYVNDIENEPFQYFLKNRAVFENKIGKKEVKDKLQSLFLNTYYNKPDKFESLKTVDSNIFNEAKTVAALNTVFGEYRKNNNAENWSKLTKVLVPYFDKKKDDAQSLNNMAWFVYENYKTFNDKKTLKSALKWAKTATELAPEKDFVLDTYANILYALGKKKQAITVETKGLELAKKNPEDTQNIENFKNNIENFKK